MQANKRYQKQIQLEDFGVQGQKKLSNGSVLVIGAGGLGCPCLQYLTAAGVGKIGIIDSDCIEESNLHRQILYAHNDIGKAKSKTAAEKLSEQNPTIKIEYYQIRLTNQNAIEILEKYDLIVDGSDNFETRYMLNDACGLLNKTYIYGSVFKYEGQIGVFNLRAEGNEKISYRDFHPKLPENENNSCEDTGVLGVLPGIIGTMQAAEAIKIIGGIGVPLYSKVISYNLKRNSFFEFSLSKNPESDANAPKSLNDFKNHSYDFLCNVDKDWEISLDQLKNNFSAENITLIDIRDLPTETVNLPYSIIHIPHKELKENIEFIFKFSSVLIFCNSGKNSLKAVEFLKSIEPKKDIYSLKNGIKGIS